MFYLPIKNHENLLKLMFEKTIVDKYLVEKTTLGEKLHGLKIT